MGKREISTNAGYFRSKTELSVELKRFEVRSEANTERKQNESVHRILLQFRVYRRRWYKKD